MAHKIAQLDAYQLLAFQPYNEPNKLIQTIYAQFHSTSHDSNLDGQIKKKEIGKTQKKVEK